MRTWVADMRLQASVPGWGSRTRGPNSFVDYPRALKSSRAKNSLSALGSLWL